MSSIFTKIIRGEIPSYKIAENDDFFAFLDIRPIAEGHTLVVPKKEVDYFFDLDESLLTEAMLFSKTLAKAIDQALSPLRTGIIVQGLEVPHAHIHLIPLYKTSQEMSLAKPIEAPSKERMEVIASKIIKAYEAIV